MTHATAQPLDGFHCDFNTARITSLRHGTGQAPGGMVCRLTGMDNVSNEPDVKKCGVVMPISAIDGCSESHWVDVYAIISNAAQTAGFSPEIVSYGDEAGIIQKRIVQNLYNNPIVVCDVSGKNPNVMFELGMRLAFDKPTIVIKDDKTSYSFDTSPLEHLTYPRDLRFQKIVEFQNNLAQKIKATYTKSMEDTEYSTFLKHFGDFTVPNIRQETVSSEIYIMEQLKALNDSVQRMDRKFNTEKYSLPINRSSTRRLAGMKNKGTIFTSDCDIVLTLHDGVDRDEVIALLNEASYVDSVATINNKGKTLINFTMSGVSKETMEAITGSLKMFGEITLLSTPFL